MGPLETKTLPNLLLDSVMTRSLVENMVRQIRKMKKRKVTPQVNRHGSQYEKREVNRD